MGQIFRHASTYINDTDDSIWVEIGSDRWEGSTEFLANLAQKTNSFLHSVDIDASASTRIKHPNLVCHVMDGEKWCQTVLPSINKPVGLIYLDNFDYDWDINDCCNDMIKEQKVEYLEKYQIEMTNQNCQVAHLRQLLALEPYLSDDAVVICDDTYTNNDCWVGKSGGVVLYLLSKDWKIVKAEDNGVILQPCKR